MNLLCTKFTRKNIPEYLFHLTTKDNYKSILQDGYIKKSHDRILNKDAVFLIEKNNYLTEWSKVFVDKDNLKNRLIEHVNLGDESVVLKITTKNLHLKKLFVRNQKKFFMLYNGQYDELPKNPLKFIRMITDAIHLRFGTPAFIKKFFNKHKPYEYIYKDKIETNNIAGIIPLKQFIEKGV